MPLKKKDQRKQKKFSHKKPANKRDHRPPGKPKGKRVTYEKDYIFWCRDCNVPLIESRCCTCGTEGMKLELSQPADVRFCSPYEREVLSKKLVASYGCDPIGERVVLLNKIPGEDKTDEVIVDGLKFGVLRFDPRELDYRLDLLTDGSRILLDSTDRKTIVLKKTKRHLKGKKVNSDMVESCTSDINKGDQVLVVCGDLAGFGTSYVDSKDIDSAEDAVLRVNRIDSGKVSLNPNILDMDGVIAANLDHIRNLGRNAMNTIKGIANQKEYSDLPVYVSFSGGKDSLVVLDLTLSALKRRTIKAFFVNTGLEFPETVDFARQYCDENDVGLIEVEAGDSFWEHLENFGPPAKDFRWCCKVCKLAPASRIIEEHSKDADLCLTVDGKRKHESFSRARTSASEMNPFVPGQLNIFPIREWRAIEVWMYIHWRRLAYNPLYDMGFERVGCHLCPAALSAEHQRLKELHPEMYDRWNDYLLEWARGHGLSPEFIEYGFWRWRQQPPKMVKLAEELGIDMVPTGMSETFGINVTSGISPCKAGGFTVEGVVRGVNLKEAASIMNIIGDTLLSEELGMLLTRNRLGSIKFFSSGSMLVTGNSKPEAIDLFNNVAKQLMRVNKCTMCGICQKVCPKDSIEVNGPNGKLHINDSCNRCGKCTQACVVMKYAYRLLPDLGAESA